MYIGRFVILGKTTEGAWYLGYRVSSRSFPNRVIVTKADRAMVVPTPDAAPSDNPYIAYNCLRAHQGTVVVANGSHVDPIIEKVAAGYGLRDAMALSLLALDYEHDDYNTPRVTAGIEARSGEGYLGIITTDRLQVRRMDVAPGQAYLIATYERNDPTPIALQGNNPEALVQAMYDCEYEKPVAALAVLPGQDGLAMVVRQAR
jgi:IMP cyclohydrolase